MTAVQVEAPAEGHRRLRWMSTGTVLPFAEILDGVAVEQGLPDAARRLVNPPAWVDTIFMEGWRDPGSAADVDPYAPRATMDVYFYRELAVARFMPADSRAGRRSLKVELSTSHTITGDGQGRFTYLERSQRVTLEPEGGDCLEFDLPDATVLLGALRWALQMTEGRR